MAVRSTLRAWSGRNHVHHQTQAGTSHLPPRQIGTTPVRTFLARTTTALSRRRLDGLPSRRMPGGIRMRGAWQLANPAVFWSRRQRGYERLRHAVALGALGGRSRDRRIAALAPMREQSSDLVLADVDHAGARRVRAAESVRADPAGRRLPPSHALGAVPGKRLGSSGFRPATTSTDSSRSPAGARGARWRANSEAGRLRRAMEANVSDSSAVSTVTRGDRGAREARHTASCLPIAVTADLSGHRMSTWARPLVEADPALAGARCSRRSISWFATGETAIRPSGELRESRRRSPELPLAI